MPKLRKFVYCSFLVGRHNKMLPLAGAVERSETKGSCGAGILPQFRFAIELPSGRRAKKLAGEQARSLDFGVSIHGGGLRQRALDGLE